MSYKVKLNIFEGPFDLLVYLIENAEMSIYDINVTEIVGQYMDYIEKMKKMDIPVAAEFMVLAASLIEIKSKMLLPRMNTEDSGSDPEDPRTELAGRLIEYKKFKAASAMLAESEEYMSHVYEKPKEDISIYENNPDEYLKMDLGHFVTAFNLFLNKKKRIEDVRKRYERLERQKMSIDEKISHIKAFFSSGKRKSVTFTEILGKEKNRYNVVVTFTSLLEMAKEKAVTLIQKANFEEITVKKCDGAENREEDSDGR